MMKSRDIESSNIRSKSTARVCMCAIALLVVSLFPLAHLRAQSTNGTIQGNVLDSSGAAVPNADIIVTNQDTGVVRTTTSTAEGGYNVPSLLPGKYTVEAKAQGFSPAQVKNVILNVGSEARADLTVQVGSTAQTVTVTEAVPTVETTSSEVSQVMTEELISNIPLNARDLQQLAVIQPGVQWMQTSFGGKQLSVSGDRPSNNRYLQEGMDMTWSYRLSPISLASGILLGTEAVKEFKVLTANFTVEYGEQSGGVVNTLFKSGTNALHGSAYEYYRNDMFDARNFFDVGPAPPFHRNQFGASLGGPIRKDKTFFFVNYEGFRHSLSQSLVATLPDDASRATAVPAITKIFFNGPNPLLPRCNGASVGNGLCIFTSHPIENIVENYGLIKIDHSFGSRNTLSAHYNIDDSWRVTPVQTAATADDVVNRRQTFTVQDTQILSSKVVNTVRFGVNRIWFNSEQDILGDLSRIDPSFVITQIVVPCAHLCSPSTPVLASGLSTALPSIIVPGMTTFGSAIQSQFNYAPRWHGYTAGMLGDDLNYLRGQHAFQFGFQGKKWQDNIENYMGSPRGQYTFQNVAQFMAGGPVQTFAFFLPSNTVLGRSMRLQFYSVYAQDTYKIKSNLTITYGLRWEHLMPPTETHGRTVTAFNPSPETVATLKTGTYYLPSTRNFAPRLGFNWDPLKKGKMSVRGGFGMFFNQVEDNSWFPGISGQYPFTTAVSLSNLMRLPFQQSILDNALAAGVAKPTIGGSIEYRPPTPTRYGYNLMVQQELPAHMSLLVGYVGAQMRHNGRVIAWQEYQPSAVEVPGQVPAINGVPITYPVYTNGVQTGTQTAPINPNCTAPGQLACLYWAGVGLTNANVSGNAAPASNFSGATAFQYASLCTSTLHSNCFVNNNFGNTINSVAYDANAFYNSLQISLERRSAAGLYVRFNYTLSKCIEDAADDLPASEGNGGGAGWSPTRNHAANRHRCSFQGLNSANLSLNYDVPFGKMVQSRMGQAVLGGWQITSLTNISSGIPFDVRTGVNVARAVNAGNGNSHPDWAPGCNPENAINKHNPTNYFKTSCFVNAPLGYLGNVGALPLTAPALWNTDVGLKKNIRITEGKTLQLGADMFNAFNRTNFSSPLSGVAFINQGSAAAPNIVGNGTAGQITSTITTSRQFQLGAKFVF
jgi:hypothetical protein